MEEQICFDYSNNFISIANLAKKYHKSRDKIREILRNNEVHILSNAERAILKRNNYKYTYEEIEKEVLKEYCENNRGQLAAGRKFNLTQENVKSILKKNGIAIRNFSEAAIASSQNRSFHKNEYYFSQQNRNMAWLMGFLAADGNISKKDNRIKISLSTVDREILERIKEDVEIENSIKEETSNRGFDITTLVWSSAQHKKDLAKYGIVPNKTFILKPPYALERKYWIDFIRGYFDGDGSVNLIKTKGTRGNGALRFQICGAKKEMLEWMVNFFYEEYGIPKVSIQASDVNRQHTLYFFQYSSRAVRKIYSVLYTDSTLFLKRKKDKFEEIMSIVNPL